MFPALIPAVLSTLLAHNAPAIGKSVYNAVGKGPSKVTNSIPKASPTNTNTEKSYDPYTGGSSASLSSGGGGGGGGRAAPAVDPEAIAYLNQQEGMLKALFGDIDATQNQGFAQLADKYASLQNAANQTQERAMRDYAVKEEDNTKGKMSSYNKVDTNARTLNDSVRKLLGLASGANSSAYQLAAPKAVARDASGKRQAVTETFGTNARNINTAKKDTELDYQRYTNELGGRKRSEEGSLLRDIGAQRNDVNQRLANVAQDRARAQGGGFSAQQAAANPYMADIASRKAELRGLFDKYRTPVNVNPINVKVPTLADFTVDKTAVNTENQGGPQDYSPYEYFLKKGQNEEQLIFS